MSIEMSLVGVRVELSSNQPIVLLREANGERFLPIFIGGFEAQAIAFALQEMVPPRPLTHDLMRDLLTAAELDVRRIVITELRDSTFYADLVVVRNDDELTVSARPSDAIALAVRAGCPIFAEEEVLEKAGICLQDDEEESQVEQFRTFLEGIKPEDFKL